MSTARKTAATAAATNTSNAATTKTATVRRRSLSAAGTRKRSQHIYTTEVAGATATAKYHGMMVA